MSHLLTDQLRLMAARLPDEVGYKNLADGATLTFRQWEERSNRLARGLVTAGIAKGERVAVLVAMDEPLAWIVAYAAVHKAGAVAVPTNGRMVARELRYVLDHAGAAAIVASDTLLAPVLDARPDLPSLRLVVSTTGSGGGGVTSWDDVLADDPGELQVPLDGDDVADIMYTSGTTGRPKGVLVRHRNVAMMPNGMPRWSGSGWMHSSPLFTFAGIASVYNPMKLGMTGLFLPRFDAARWLALVEQERPGAMFIVPAMAQLLIAHPDFECTDFSSLWLCSIGSAPLAPETLRRLQARMPGANVSNSYGMTEAGPAYCAMPAGEAERRVGSVGKPMPPVEFRVVGDDGTPVGPRDVGELQIRNPGRQREYYNDPEATASAWTDDGWLRSGDLAYLDGDGFLYIVGRKKDVIIRGGNNVHAKDVEDALFEHPWVQEAAVAGIPHEVLGEDVAAWVVLAPGAATTAEELRAHCAQRLADYKVPRRITLVAELPRNATGKVLKQQLVASL